MQIGTRVRTKATFMGAQREGVVISTQGAYIYVRLDYHDVVIEAYDIELEVLNVP